MKTSSLDSRPAVLVVGAGPVGLLAAISLRELGVPVRVIDEQVAEDKRTYPVIIHPRSLRILDGLGVAAPLEWRGHSVSNLVVVVDSQRRAILELPSAGRVSPGAMTLPQDVLRRALMQRLSQLGTEVEWKTRLSMIEQDADHVRVGSIRRELIEGGERAGAREWLDVEVESADYEFVIGADGVGSTVRRKLGIELSAHGKRQIYAFYDAPDTRAGCEAQLVVREGLGNTVYPLQGELSRFSFQLSVGMPHPPGATQLRQLLAARLPWYGVAPKAVEWSGSMEFQACLADRFGKGRIWLAGDAAHSTGPLGGQSLNAGLHEAHDLARRMSEQLGRTGALPLLGNYDKQRRLEWQVLLGLGSSAPNAGKAPDWVRRNLNGLLQALPGTGDDLDDLLEQLHVKAA
jgi:2-polyprenyl-6-methoxyphenol hydroxylase-like FAD-dependent oxidoreductase